MNLKNIVIFIILLNVNFIGLSEESVLKKEDDIAFNYKNFILLFPNSEKVPYAYFSLGTIFYLKKDWNVAVREYEIIIKDYSNHKLIPNTLLMLAKCYIKLKQFQKASKCLINFIDGFNKNAFVHDAFIMLANCYEETKNYDKAIKIYNALINEEKNYFKKIELMINLTKILIKLKNFKEAEVVLTNIALNNNFEKNQKILEGYIFCLYSLNKDFEFLNKVNVYYKNFSVNNEFIKILHAEVCFRNNNFFMSYSIAKSLLENNSNYIKFKSSLIATKSLKEIGFFKPEIIENVISGHEAESDIVPLLYELGLIYREMKQWQKSKNIFKKIQGKYADIVYFKIIENDFLAGDYENCIREFIKIRAKIKSAEVLKLCYEKIALCFFKLGDLDKAKKIYEGKF